MICLAVVEEFRRFQFVEEFFNWLVDSSLSEEYYIFIVIQFLRLTFSEGGRLEQKRLVHLFRLKVLKLGEQFAKMMRYERFLFHQQLPRSSLTLSVVFS